ncbi:hypothetical protein IEQ34_008073 [Dendrobium chrysotoxum]|uniref:Uncharacterized protein n=1 Tax=Dendrobium chrysotoxum TaxID=161865 RepID=A0AAV7H4S2_DENCH|nr:hypothetical protein IEQ34_008073 [Dendrobium chrysotoxum]
MPKNDLIGRGKDKEFVMQWLRKPLNEDHSTLYRNMSLLSIVGHGGMGKTTLLQHAYEDGLSCIDVAKVIKKKETLRLEGLEEDECLQLLNSHAFADVENPGAHKKTKINCWRNS